jgi:hypothetical protein
MTEPRVSYNTLYLVRFNVNFVTKFTTQEQPLTWESDVHSQPFNSSAFGTKWQTMLDGGLKHVIDAKGESDRNPPREHHL